MLIDGKLNIHGLVIILIAQEAPSRSLSEIKSLMMIRMDFCNIDCNIMITIIIQCKDLFSREGKRKRFLTALKSNATELVLTLFLDEICS